MKKIYSIFIIFGILLLISNTVFATKYNNYEYNLNKCDIEESENDRLFNIFDNKNNEIKIYEKGVMNYKINLNLN